MADYRPILFHSQFSVGCARIRRTIRHLGIDVNLRNILISRRNREDLMRATGELRVPCLLVAGTVVQGTDEIIKYLHLRYGEKQNWITPRI